MGPDKSKAAQMETEVQNDKAREGVAAARGAAATSTAAQQARERVRQAVDGGPGVTKPTAGIQDLFVDERNDVLTVINELEDQLDRQQELREGLERELTKSAEQLQASGQRAQELEWQVVTLQTRVDALEQVRQQAALLEEELNDATTRAHQLKEQLGTTEKERVRLKNELKAATKQVDELWAVRKERDNLRSDYKSVSIKVEELERTQRDMFEERGQLQAELQDAHAAGEHLTSERNQLQMALRAVEDKVRELVQVQDGLNDKIDTLRAEKKNLQVQLTHIERENARLVEQRQFYEGEVTALRNQSRTAEAALASVKKAFTEVRMALTETKVRAQRRAIDTWPRIGSSVVTGGVIASAEADALSVGGDVEPLGPGPGLSDARSTIDTPAHSEAEAE